jgi:hypothetical protein
MVYVGEEIINVFENTKKKLKKKGQKQFKKWSYN